MVTFTAVKTKVFVEAFNVKEAISFYESVFGAEAVTTTTRFQVVEPPVPWLISAKIELGPVSIIVADVYAVSDVEEDYDVDDTVNRVGLGVEFYLETEDIEATVDKAVKAGADGKIIEGVGDSFCGGRLGKVKDPYGIVWFIKKSANVEA